MCIVICESMIVKFSDWQAIVVGIKHEAYACPLSGVGVDGLMGTSHMGPRAQ